MPVRVEFECSGCFIKRQGTRPIGRTFVGVGSHSYRYDTIWDVTPEGWITADLHTGCCYCPKCWMEIEDES